MTADAALFCFPLTSANDFQAALVEDRNSAECDQAHRDTGLTRARVWVQHIPAFGIVSWEGPDVNRSRRYAETSDEDFVTRWRELLRISSGQKGSESLWDAGSNSIVFEWSTDEEACQQDVSVHEASSVVADYLIYLKDIEADPVMSQGHDSLRRSQGLTSVEVSHQKFGDRQVLLRSIEGNDLDSAFDSIGKAENEFDQRLAGIGGGSEGLFVSPGRASLIVDWNLV